MPKKTGVCINISNCTKARNRELQTVEATNFVCEECGKDLKEKATKKSKGSNPKIIIAIIAIVAIIAGVAYGVSTCEGDSKPATTGGESDTTVVVEPDTTPQTNPVEVEPEEPPVIDPVVPEEPAAPYTYEGATQNGKPHGNGTMTFNKKMIVPGSKGSIVAQPGEYATGKWVNGEVNLVTLYQKSGNRVIITHK